MFRVKSYKYNICQINKSHFLCFNFIWLFSATIHCEATAVICVSFVVSSLLLPLCFGLLHLVFVLWYSSSYVYLNN